MIRINEEVQQEKDHQFMNTFERELRENWNARRTLPNAGQCNTKCKPGFLRLIFGESLQSIFEYHLSAIRQMDFTLDTETALGYMSNNFNQMAGLMLCLDESSYIYCYVT